MVAQDIVALTVSGISPKMSGMASVQRHPTMPMTKRDSLTITGSRISLISTGSNTTATKPEDKDTVNTNPDMVAGRRRSPKKVKRTDSYKKALNRQSQYDNLEEQPVAAKPDIARTREERQKYNTLPINTGKPTCNGNMSQNRKKRPSGQSDTGGEILREVSQKSGTYPSPDTDEDQRAIQPERKKKSAFKKFKERFISTVRRDSRSEKKSKKRQERGSQSSSKRASRIRPNHSHSTAGFITPIENSAKPRTVQNGHHVDTVDGGVQILLNGSKDHDHADDYSSGRKKEGLLTVLRRSFRRKLSSPELRGSKKDSSDNRPSSSEIHLSPKGNNSHRKPTTPKTSSPIAKPVRQQAPEDIAEDDIFDNEDTITSIFGSIIENRRPSIFDDRRPSYFDSLAPPCPQRAPVDRTTLRLEGLRKCRPKSFERGHSRAGYQSSDLSPTVEIDGIDFADGVAEQVPMRPSDQRREEADQLFYEVSQEEKERRIDEVARRLSALGDRIAAEKELESAGSSSELESHRIGGPRSSLEMGLIRDLRDYADHNFGGQSGVSITVNLMPVVKNIIAAQNYPNFQHVMQEELSKTNGWEQVAWYTYLIKTAVCIADSNVGGEVKKRAKKYFNAVLKPWIKSRPNGWDSIHEETDIESEVD